MSASALSSPIRAVFFLSLVHGSSRRKIVSRSRPPTVHVFCTLRRDNCPADEWCVLRWVLEDVYYFVVTRVYNVYTQFTGLNFNRSFRRHVTSTKHSENARTRNVDILLFVLLHVFNRVKTMFKLIENSIGFFQNVSVTQNIHVTRRLYFGNMNSVRQNTYRTVKPTLATVWAENRASYARFRWRFTRHDSTYAQTWHLSTGVFSLCGVTCIATRFVSTTRRNPAGLYVKRDRRPKN